MSRDVNKVTATGRLGKDVDLRFTPQGAAVATFSIASGRQWNSKDGERQDATEWINCVAWEKLGEVCGKYLQKGSRIYIEGRLQTRSWEKDDGTKGYKTEVILSDMIMLDSKPRDEQPRDADGDEIEDGFEAPQAPPARQAPARPAAAPASQSVRAIPRTGASAPRPVVRNVPQTIDEEELPF